MSGDIPVSNGRYATLDCLPPLLAGTLGFPDRSPELDVLPGFRNPPKGYGEVPFYWWTGGEKLTKERLMWHLEKLHEAGVQGLNINYAHSHSRIDVELNKGWQGVFGITLPSDPPIFSDEWWELWDWFASECAKRDMGIGVDDFCLCFPGNREWPDKIAAMPKMKQYQGRLIFNKDTIIKGGKEATIKLSTNIISLAAYRQVGKNLEGNSAINLLPLARKDVIHWQAPEGTWQVVSVSTSPDFTLHPEHGQEVIRHYFQQFEDRVGPAARKGLNFFFQDELRLTLKGKINTNAWSEDFPQEFLKRKGYDIQPHLAAIRYDIGARTPKIRLDYTDVVVTLLEERYFQPVFEWHWKRGMIYGCDNLGRGLRADAYGDYFRANRWYGAPGNDAPRGATALIQTKVSSSIAHLYQRPRVWLEAFYGMGWDAKPAQFNEATEKHLLLGGNLFSFHGLYYTTYGSWWEWAPPDFHFRMPYWPHMKTWLEHTERLCYLLSQGHHVCDVAIMYPVSPLQAKNGGSTKSSFDMAWRMYDAGMDFDFIDFQSLARAEAHDSHLSIAGENYRVLILPDMTAVRFTTLQKALAHFRNGGVVIALGKLPEASDRIGRDDPEIDKILMELFSLNAKEASNGKAASIQRNATGGVGLYCGNNMAAALKTIDESISRDFIPGGKKGGHVFHRRVGKRDVYMLMDIAKDTECFFRCKGKAELWSPWTGEFRPLSVTRQTDEGTYVRIPLAPPQSNLIVFSPGEPVFVKEQIAKNNLPSPVSLNGQWESELVPTLDNRFGDFRLPATNVFIGPEARRFKYCAEEQAGKHWQDKDFDDAHWRKVTASFGPRLRMLHLPDKYSASAEDILQTGDNPAYEANDGTLFLWRPYEYSWRWGVENHPGSQGYHGMKGNVSDDFLIMGRSGSYYFRTSVTVTEKTNAQLVVSGREPETVWLNGQLLAERQVVLDKGKNDLFFSYSGVKGQTHRDSVHIHDKRTRSAVVLVKQDAASHKEYPLAMRWYTQPERLEYDIQGGKQTVGCYRFIAPPGLSEIDFDYYGDELRAWIDGEEVEAISVTATDEKCLQHCRVSLPAAQQETCSVAFSMTHKPGCYAGAAIPEPITLTCGKGRIKNGDWAKLGVLETYSGGMWYRRTVNLKQLQTDFRTVLELGKVVATCEVWINGKKVGVCVADPFSLDISNHIKPGDNKIEILVYNTLSNHYQTVPTAKAYKKTTTSGLIGPVKISFTETQ
jgi:alpha-L-rhamnosidase/Glycosyl hydrolases family 2, sugar binding domain